MFGAVLLQRNYIFVGAKEPEYSQLILRFAQVPTQNKKSRIRAGMLGD
jgi:hypothetical protein